MRQLIFARSTLSGAEVIRRAGQAGDALENVVGHIAKAKADLAIASPRRHRREQQELEIIVEVLLYGDEELYGLI